VAVETFESGFAGEVRRFHLSLLPNDRVPNAEDYRIADQGTAWWFELSEADVVGYLEP
jgi:hypothetical protein